MEETQFIDTFFFSYTKVIDQGVELYVDQNGQIVNADKKLLKWKKVRHFFYVHTYKNGLQIRHAVNIIIAKAFVPNPFNWKYVEHINGLTNDNSVWNLRWTNKRPYVKRPDTLKKVPKVQILATFDNKGDIYEFVDSLNLVWNQVNDHQYDLYQDGELRHNFKVVKRNKNKFEFHVVDMPFKVASINLDQSNWKIIITGQEDQTLEF